jgi:hypothetical protein
MQQKANRLRNPQRKTNRRYRIVGKYVNREVSERTVGEKAIKLASAAPLNHLVGGILNGIERVRFCAESRGAE